MALGSVVLGIEQNDVRQGSQLLLTQLFETYAGSGQGDPSASGITIMITASGLPGGGSGTPVPQTSTGVSGNGLGEWSYTWACALLQAPGDYLVTWQSATGAGGPLAYTQTVTVAAVPPGAPAPGVYASVAQYQAWSGDFVTPAAVISVKLQRASEDIDRALIGAVYAVNSGGMPADALVINAIMRACCAQCQWLIAQNDDPGVKYQYASQNVAGVSAARVKTMTGLELSPLGPRALSILHAEGIIPSAVLVAW